MERLGWQRHASCPRTRSICLLSIFTNRNPGSRNFGTSPHVQGNQFRGKSRASLCRTPESRDSRPPDWAQRSRGSGELALALAIRRRRRRRPVGSASGGRERATSRERFGPPLGVHTQRCTRGEAISRTRTAQYEGPEKSRWNCAPLHVHLCVARSPGGRQKISMKIPIVFHQPLIVCLRVGKLIPHRLISGLLRAREGEHWREASRSEKAWR